jgi:hypothetical protein
MKKITKSLIFPAIAIISLMSCENKKTKEEKTENTQQMDSVNNQKSNKVDTENTVKPNDNLSFNAYTFAENLKNDSFFESDNTDKTIELKNVGITSYFISGNEVTLCGIFYDKEKNQAIPRYNNNPPGRSFVSEYFDKLEMKYNEDYKRTYSAVLSIILKNPKDVKKLKMYIASEPTRNFEYQVEGTADEFRSGFIDLLNIKGKFTGENAASNYPNKVYEVIDAEIN